MKKALFLLFFICLGFVTFGQEFEGDQPKEIRAENRQIEEEIPIFQSLDFGLQSGRMGPFDVARYAVPINLIDIGYPTTETEDTNFDILAISRAKERRRESQMRSVDVTRQAEQIRAQVRVFSNQNKNPSASWDRNIDPFNNQRLRDGSIRNEALRQSRQPFMNPYDQYYNRGYYGPGYYNGLSPHYGGRGFHFYRR